VTTPYLVDLTAALEQMRATLRDELLADLRAERDAAAWPEWMSVDTAARYLDVSPERLRKLQARRQIPYHQEDVGCRVLFRRTDLDSWMNTFRVDLDR
jgi:excisionase family DNA binding protein